jgi:hypothetical protein
MWRVVFGLFCLLASMCRTTVAAPSAELVQVSPTAFSAKKPLLG